VLEDGADYWVLKMHGCVAHPEDMVLMREHQISYGENHAGLAGIVQTLLITRHMLFAGFSLSDDDFRRIAEAVRRVVRRASRPGGDPKPFGTAVVLERSPLVEELWKDELRWVGMSEPGQDGAGAAAARRLDIFLDYLAAQTRDAAHLLDGRYPAVLTPEETALRDALLRFAGDLPAAARHAPAWARVSRLLQDFGLANAEAPAKADR
jgi:hypothetical protein